MYELTQFMSTYLKIFVCSFCLQMFEIYIMFSINYVLPHIIYIAWIVLVINSCFLQGLIESIKLTTEHHF